MLSKPRPFTSVWTQLVGFFLLLSRYSSNSSAGGSTRASKSSPGRPISVVFGSSSWAAPPATTAFQDMGCSKKLAWVGMISFEAGKLCRYGTADADFVGGAFTANAVHGLRRERGGWGSVLRGAVWGGSKIQRVRGCGPKYEGSAVHKGATWGQSTSPLRIKREPHLCSDSL